MAWAKWAGLLQSALPTLRACAEIYSRQGWAPTSPSSGHLLRLFTTLDTRRSLWREHSENYLKGTGFSLVGNRRKHPTPAAARSRCTLLSLQLRWLATKPLSYRTTTDLPTLTFQVRSPKLFATFLENETYLSFYHAVGANYHFQRPERASQELKIWEA